MNHAQARLHRGAGIHCARVVGCKSPFPLSSLSSSLANRKLQILVGSSREPGTAVRRGATAQTKPLPHHLQGRIWYSHVLSWQILPFNYPDEQRAPLGHCTEGQQLSAVRAELVPPGRQVEEEEGGMLQRGKPAERGGAGRCGELRGSLHSPCVGAGARLRQSENSESWRGVARVSPPAVIGCWPERAPCWRGDPALAPRSAAGWGGCASHLR